MVHSLRRHASMLTLVLTVPLAAGFTDGASIRAQEIIPIEAHGGAFVVPVLINGVLRLNFIVDSGAADVSIPADAAATLQRLGTLSGNDRLGTRTYVLADGSKVPSEIYKIASLKVGDRVMENVTVRVTSEKSGPLLGQSFLSRLNSWSMDNNRRVLIID
jgi:clan AA aspartic protease (TIGR02281 family)